MESGKYDEKVLSNLEEKKYIVIIKNIDKEIILNPKDSMSWYFRGRCKYLLGKYEEAIKDLENAIELNPKEADYFILLAKVYLDINNYKIAENNFKKAYDLNKNKLQFDKNLGSIFYRKKDFYYSIKYFLNALKEDPNNYDTYLNLSFAKFDLGDYENSFEDLKKAKELFNKQNEREFLSIFNSNELIQLMKIYESHNDLNKVEEIILYMNNNNKNSNYNLVIKGILEFKKGCFYNAISNLLEVYEIDKQNKECILYLGKSKLELKDYQNALIHFKEYKELESNNEIDKLIKTCEENLNSN